MKQQIVVIHGADSYATYEEYLKELEDFTIQSLDYFRGGGWKKGLADSLGDDYEVIAPSMPNKFNARYVEWKIWFEKLTPFIEDGVIFVGHSMGGVFLAKYLSENVFPRKIRATLLVAAPFDTDQGRPMTEFAMIASLELFKEQSEKIFLYHSKDDAVVQFAELAKYRAQLPDAVVRIFEDRNHFEKETFPEIVEDIRSLA